MHKDKESIDNTSSNGLHTIPSCSQLSVFSSERSPQDQSSASVTSSFIPATCHSSCFSTTAQLLKCGLHATTHASAPPHSFCSAGCSACHPRSTGQQGYTVAANCLLQLLQSLPISDLRSGSSLQQLRQELTAQPNSPGLDMCDPLSLVPRPLCPIGVT